MEWASLIGRIADCGDREAFKLLFEHFAPRLKGFLVKTGSDADAAEEIAQNTMVVVWKKAGQFDPATTGAAAWIFTIARNLRIDAARLSARQARTKRQAGFYRASDVVESPETTITRRDDATRLEVALKKLSAEQYSLVRLSFIDERSHAEIASVLDIPLGTVKSRVRLAIGRLRELLDETQ